MKCKFFLNLWFDFYPVISSQTLFFREIKFELQNIPLNVITSDETKNDYNVQI